MSMERLLGELLPENGSALDKVTVIRLSNGETITVEKNPDNNRYTGRWGVDGHVFKRDNYAEDCLRRLIWEKLTGTRVLMRPRYEKPQVCGESCPNPKYNSGLCVYCPIADDANAKADGVRLVYAVMSKEELADIQKKALCAILKAIKSCGFNIYVDEENGKECGLEIEKWTPNGVDMCHYIDFRDCENPYDPNILLEQLRAMVSAYDPDEEIRVHMEDSNFRSDFSYRRAVEEFEGWQQTLQELADCAGDYAKKTLDACRTLPLENNLSYKELLEEND